MLKHLFQAHAAILALIISLTIVFFVGCFANPPVNMDASFSGKYWYYINRGYPLAWAGVSLAGTKIDFPLVKMPFLSADDGRGTALVKIIDLSGFMPIFLGVFLISYIPSFILAKAVDENKNLLPFLIGLDIFITAIGIFIYFSWFSRI